MPSIIRAGVKAESRKKLIERWKANAAQEAAKASKEAEALGARAEAAQGRSREAFLAALGSDPGTRSLRKELASIEKAIVALSKRPATTPAQQRAVQKELEKLRNSMDALESEHRAPLMQAYQRLVKPDAYRAAMLKAFKKPGRIEMKELRFGGFRLLWIPPWLDRIDWTTITNPRTSFTFEPPYDEDAVVSEELSVLIGAAHASPNADTGRVSSNIFAADAGYQMARAQLGAFLTIPAGFETLKLQARVVDISASVTALAVGASWASSGTIAEITDFTSNTTRRAEGSINYVVAPVIFYAHDVFEGPSIFNAELEISGEGGEILVTAGLKCDVWAAGLGGGIASISGTVEKITVEVT
jgi:hypothetical protein